MMPVERLAYTPPELAEATGKSRRAVWYWIQKGKIRCNNGLIPAEDVRNLIYGPQKVQRDPEADQLIEGM